MHVDISISSLNSVIQNEYATRYLEGIGATPSKENKEQVLTHFPLQDIAVMPVWVREMLLIVPGLKAKDTLGDTTALVQELYRREQLSTTVIPKKNSRGNIEFNKSSRIKHPSHQGKVKDNDNEEEKKKFCSKSIRRRLLKSDPSISDVLYYLEQHDMFILQRLGANGLREILAPPRMREKEDVIGAVDRFVEVMRDYVPSVRRERDTTERMRADIKTLLRSPACVGLFALLTHYCYWSVLHPLTRRAIVLSKAMIKRSSIHSGQNATDQYQDLHPRSPSVINSNADNSNAVNNNSLSASMSYEDSLSQSLNLGNSLDEDGMYIDHISAASHFEQTFGSQWGPERGEGQRGEEKGGEGDGVENDENQYNQRKFPGIIFDMENNTNFTVPLQGDSESVYSAYSLSSLASETSLSNGERERLFLQVHACLSELRVKVSICRDVSSIFNNHVYMHLKFYSLLAKMVTLNNCYVVYSISLYCICSLFFVMFCDILYMILIYLMYKYIAFLHNPTG